MPGAHLLDVRGLEEIAARTWRGLEEERHGDWLLRAGGGFSGRANSALVVGEAPAPLVEAVASVARWYAARGLPPKAQLPGPPGAADAAFAADGWIRSEDVLVLTAPLARWPAPDVPVDLSPAPDAAWLAGYRYRGVALPPEAGAVLTHARDPLFASVRPDPAPAPPAAVARGAVEDGLLALYARLGFTEHHRYHYRSAPA